MALLDGAFRREAERVIRHAPKHNPGLAALIRPGENPICVETTAQVPPGKVYGAFLATDAALYTRSPNVGRGIWVRTPWEAMQTLLLDWSENGYVSMLVYFDPAGPGVERWRPDCGKDALAPHDIVKLVADGEVILDPYLVTNPGHVKQVTEFAVTKGVELQQRGPGRPKHWHPTNEG